MEKKSELENQSIVELIINLNGLENEGISNTLYLISSLLNLTETYKESTEKKWFESNFRVWDVHEWYQFLYSFVQSYSQGIEVEFDNNPNVDLETILPGYKIVVGERLLTPEKKYIPAAMKLFHDIHNSCSTLSNHLQKNVIDVISHEKSLELFKEYANIYNDPNYSYSKYFIVLLHFTRIIQFLPPEEVPQMPFILQAFKKIHDQDVNSK